MKLGNEETYYVECDRKVGFQIRLGRVNLWVMPPMCWGLYFDWHGPSADCCWLWISCCGVDLTISKDRSK